MVIQFGIICGANESRRNLSGELLVAICPTSIVLSLVAFILSIFTITGNVFVIIAILTDRKIGRKMTSVLICNLAIADLLVGAVVMPLGIATVLTGGQWLFGPLLCRVWTSLDVICSTASIVTLCVISVDRFVGVMHPLRYQTLITRRRLVLSSCSVWLFSVGVLLGTIQYSAANGFRQDYVCRVSDQLQYVTYSVVFSFFIPMCIILLVYFKIYRVTKRREEGLLHNVNFNVAMSKHRSNRDLSASDFVQLDQRSTASDPCNQLEDTDKRSLDKRRGTTAAVYTPTLRIHYGGSESEVEKQRKFYQNHKKSAKTLGLVVGAFLLCWFPFFTLYLFDNFCECVTPILLEFFTWLGYSNSAVNPIIYAVIVKAFREAFLKILRQNLCGGAENSPKLPPPLPKSSVSTNAKSNLVGGHSTIPNNVVRFQLSSFKERLTLRRMEEEAQSEVEEQSDSFPLARWNREVHSEQRLSCPAEARFGVFSTPRSVSTSTSWMNLKLYTTLISAKATEL